MTDETEKEQPEAADETEKAPPAPPADPVKRLTLILLGLAFAMAVLHLLSDRYTPYTSQARLNAIVVPVAAEVSGSVIDVEVSNNQRVGAGETLFRIDPANYQLALQTAEANLEAARQAVGVSVANVDAARAAVASAESQLQQSQQDFERMQRIREEDEGAISERRVEQAESARDTAQARLNQARAGLQSAIENLGRDDEQNSRMLQAQAALDQARINLDNTIVVAPADGVVTDVRIDKGTFAGAGAPQMTFIGTGNVWVQADFTENNLGHIEPGDDVEVLFDVLPGQVFKGKVREIGFGVKVDSAPLGSLPTIQNDRDWLRDAQRFAVLVDVSNLSDISERRRLKVGSQASVLVYAGDSAFLNLLGKLYIRVASMLTYAY